jgi:hypothetical protein
VTAEIAIDALGTPRPTASELSSVTRRRILLYFAGLIVLLGFPGSLINLPISFFLKNKLHLAAHELALFGLIANIPVYCAVAFGFTRDVWSPFGRGDRGFVMLFGALGAITCLSFAFASPTYQMLLAAALLIAVSLLFIRSALRGLIATVGQQNAMTGQVSAVMSAFEVLPGIAGILAGGALSQLMEGQRAEQGARLLFSVGAALMVTIALYGVLKPASVFEHVHRERIAGSHPLDDLKRLFKHRAIYPALLIWLLWQFVPGIETPLQYFLQNTLKFSDAQYGLWFALYIAGAMPTYILFGLLCRRFPLRQLLFWGTLGALPMMVPLVFIHHTLSALIAAPLMGMTGGVAGAAYFDLIIRSCPRGLQGSVLMAASGLLAIDGQFGNILGTSLYDHFHDFTVCVIAMTVTNALILPALLLVPRDLVARADGAAPA